MMGETDDEPYIRPDFLNNMYTEPLGRKRNTENSSRIVCLINDFGGM